MATYLLEKDCEQYSTDSEQVKNRYLASGFDLVNYEKGKRSIVENAKGKLNVDKLKDENKKLISDLQTVIEKNIKLTNELDIAKAGLEIARKAEVEAVAKAEAALKAKDIAEAELKKAKK